MDITELSYGIILKMITGIRGWNRNLETNNNAEKSRAITY